MPLESRTRATLRSAEFGFLGVMVLTCRQTPRFCGQPCRAGCLGRRYCCRLGLRTSWLMVGMISPSFQPAAASARGCFKARKTYVMRPGKIGQEECRENAAANSLDAAM